MLYTHNELHVPPGEDAGYILSPWSPPAAPADDDDALAASSLAENGWCILPRACSDASVAAARAYVAARRDDWALSRLRPDDWRCHLDQPLGAGAAVADGHASLLSLLRDSGALARLLAALGGGALPDGVLYTQAAYRTPLAKRRGRRDERPGTSYHIDGEANASGARFPDHFSLIAAVALSDQAAPDAGNLAVFDGHHVATNWARYPDRKRRRDLPDLGTPTQLRLAPGDVALVHPLLPHRGGTNGSSVTRELVFFRLRWPGVRYDSAAREAALLEDPLGELVLPSVGAPLCRCF